MAYLVYIDRVEETFDFVDYRFKGSGYNIQPGDGMLRINKQTGEIDVLEHSGPDWEKLFEMAMMKLAKHWYSHDFPEHTTFAA